MKGFISTINFLVGSLRPNQSRLPVNSAAFPKALTIDFSDFSTCMVLEGSSWAISADPIIIVRELLKSWATPLAISPNASMGDISEVILELQVILFHCFQRKPLLLFASKWVSKLFCFLIKLDHYYGYGDSWGSAKQCYKNAAANPLIGQGGSWFLRQGR